MKRTLKIILIIVLMMCMIFGLTACGDEEEASSSRRKKSSSDKDTTTSQSEDEIDLEEKDETVTTSKSDNNGAFSKTSKKSVDIEKICGVNKDETKIVALLKGDPDEDATVIISNISGKISKEFQVPNYGVEVINGTWIKCKNIYDFDGNLWYKDEVGTKFLDISEGGFVLRTSETDSMATGKVTTYEIYDPTNDKVIKNFEHEIQYSGLKDYFLLAEKAAFSNDFYLSEYSYAVYDAKTQKDIKSDEVYKDFGEALKNISFPYVDGKDGILSLKDGYIFKDNKIVDLSGKELKDISEGEPTIVKYIDGYFYIITKTDYWYVLDKNFNYVLEPEKTHNFFTSDGSVSYFTKNGIFSLLHSTLFSAENNGYTNYYEVNTLKNGTLELFEDYKVLKDSRIYYRLYTNGSKKVDEKLLQPIKANDYGIAANLQDGNVEVLINDKEYLYKDCEIQEFSKKIMIIYEKDSDYEQEGETFEAGRYNKNPRLLNLETQEEIVFHK